MTIKLCYKVVQGKVTSNLIYSDGLCSSTLQHKLFLMYFGKLQEFMTQTHWVNL